MKQSIIDIIYRWYLAICISYYVSDILIKSFEMLFMGDKVDMCKAGFLSHHIMTIIAFKGIFLSDVYPWFLQGPMSFHTIVVGFPEFSLYTNVVYFLFVVAFIYNLTKEPFVSKKVYRALATFSLLLLIPLALLAWRNCMQEFDWDEWMNRLL